MWVNTTILKSRPTNGAAMNIPGEDETGQLMDAEAQTKDRRNTEPDSMPRANGKKTHE